LIEILAEEPNLSIEEAVKKLGVSSITEAELKNIILQRLTLFDSSRILSDEAYRKLAVPRIVGEVLKSVNYSVRGEKVVEEIHALISQGRNRNVQ
jgi:Glu-tRNA(Gln) amidotransferase subunit E-like FAD-binding protein